MDLGPGIHRRHYIAECQFVGKDIKRALGDNRELGLNNCQVNKNLLILREDYEHYLIQAFKPTLTDMGLCHSLNSEAIGNLFKPSTYLDSLAKSLQDKDVFGDEDALESEGEPVKTKGSGSLHKTRIVLDAQSLKEFQ